jgi:hypothetical protein
MKRILAMGLATFFALPIIATAIVFAEDDDTTTNQDTTQSTDDSTQTKEEALEARLEKRKAQFELKLTFLEELRLKNRCKASQGLISRVEKRIKGIETSRTRVYDNIVNHLNALVTKLKANDIDTTELEASLTTLQTKIDAFNTDLATYKQAVSDLVAIECQDDPEGFQASLEAARAALEKVKTDAKEVRTYLKDTIKPLIVGLRSQVEAKQEDDNEGGN